MMRRRMFALAAAVALASATSATAVGAPKNSAARASGLEPCQVEHYHWCMAKFGDHSYCYWEAEITPC